MFNGKWNECFLQFTTHYFTTDNLLDITIRFKQLTDRGQIKGEQNAAVYQAIRIIDSAQQICLYVYTKKRKRYQRTI